MSAPDAVAQLAKDLLKDVATISPKHACTKEFFGIEAGVVPERGDPTRDGVLSSMALTRHGLGVCIWLQNATLHLDHAWDWCSLQEHSQSSRAHP